jgi:hypothetical protein
MKIDEFLKNPMGKGAIIPGKDTMLTSLDYRLKVLQDHKDIDMQIYTRGKDVYYHFIMPTENKDRDNTYDVIIKFKETDKSDAYDQTYRQYQIEFFSNCPSFTYGYAYVANLNGYFIKEFANKYEPQILKYPPVSKNPGLIFSYEKSIYFACKCLMANKRVLLKSHVESYGKKLTPEVIKSIRHMNVIEEEYKKADKIMREYKKKNKLEFDKKTKRKKEELISQYDANGKKKENVSTVKKIKAKASNINKIKPMKKKK